MESTAHESFLPVLSAFLESRLANPPEGSYSHKLMTDHVLVRRKIMEEAFEVCLELESTPVDHRLLAEEAADVVFHVLCGLIGAGASWADVEAVLVARHGSPAR